MPTINLSSVTLFPSFQQGPKIQFCLSNSSFLYSFKPKRFHFLKPCSCALRETKKQQQQQQQQTLLKTTPNKSPQSSSRRLLKNDDDSESGRDIGSGDGGDNAIKGTILAGLLIVGVVGGFGTVGYIYKDQINAFLNQFSGFIEG